MKVKEFIRQLEQLDQEKNIWTIYDSFSVSEPEIEVVTDENCPLEYLSDKGLKEGDYTVFLT
jgi:hypothetical protein